MNRNKRQEDRYIVTSGASPLTTALPLCEARMKRDTLEDNLSAEVNIMSVEKFVEKVKAKRREEHIKDITEKLEEALGRER